jgi:hypothetical protein
MGDKPGEGWVIEDGALVRKSKAGDIWTKQRFGDFVLQLEFKTKGNSGVFIRTDDPKNNVQTGIEIQVDKPARTGNTALERCTMQSPLQRTPQPTLEPAGRSPPRTTSCRSS